MNVTIRDHVVTVTLSRSNLEALLLKLDEPTSQRTLFRRTESENLLFVKAEEDEEHYADRSRGLVHPREERKMTERRVA